MNKAILTVLALILGTGVLVATASSALAYRGDHNVQGPNHSSERHNAMEKAFETKNYDAWKNLMQGRGRVTKLINKDNFMKFAEAHELAEQGKFEEARKIRQELRLGMRDGSGQGRRMGMGKN